MKRRIAYPDEFLSNEKLDDYHRNLVIDDKSFLSTSLNINKFLDTKIFESIGRPFNYAEWTGAFGKKGVPETN